MVLAAPGLLALVNAGCVCVLLLQDLLQSCSRGGRRRVEDMCYERRRAEACVDESAPGSCRAIFFLTMCAKKKIPSILLQQKADATVLQQKADATVTTRRFGNRRVCALRVTCVFPASSNRCELVWEISWNVPLLCLGAVKSGDHDKEPQDQTTTSCPRIPKATYQKRPRMGP
jgi:hypothetical protein